MRTAELRKFEFAVSSLYETVLDQSQWGVAIRNVAALFEADTASVFRMDCATYTPSDFRTYGLDPEVERVYAAYFHLIDPARERGIRSGVGEWLADEQMLDLRTREHQEFVRDFALRHGIGGRACCKVMADDESLVFLSVHRSPGAARFGDHGRQIYRALEPHLMRVGRMHATLSDGIAGSTIARACLDRLHIGVLVVDRSAWVHLVNDLGLKLIARGHAVSIASHRMHGVKPALDERLGRLIAAACAEPARGGALCIHDEGPGAGVLYVSVLPIPQGHDLAHASGEPLALVVLSDPATSPSQAGLLRDLFALTRAEAELMAALVGGMTVHDWAMHQGTSVNTVRAQLRTVFEKTGADSQARLVGLAKSLPPFS